MNSLKTDVAVIGCGIAGLTAAKQVARRGKQVAVFSKAYGATAMSTGVADIANPTVIRIPLEPPDGLLRKRYGTNPNHPYGLILKRESQNTSRPLREGENGCGETITKAISDFKEDMRNEKYPVEGSLEHNMLIINSIGLIRTTCLAPPSVGRGDLTRMEKGRIVFVGFKRHSDYDPNRCYQNFTSIKSILRLPLEVNGCSSTVIDLPNFEGRNTLLSIEVAREIEREEGVAKKVGRMIAGAANGLGATHACLPPCMGIRNVEENMKIIGEESGLIPFECVNLTPPSVLGYRLQLALDDSASDSGVPIMLPYETSAFEAEGKTLRNMTVVSGERKFQVEAEKFVLATGSFIGGGIVEKDETAKEPLLNLPLFDENGREADGVFIRTMLSSEAVPMGGHSVFSIGVKVNENMQPTTTQGEVIYGNLFACGNILSGFSHTSGGCRYGVAISTGYVAGDEASRN
ncbi:MAG: FAD-dependent oxidoreductase [Candidatus Atabeyarchaeum deiterrae]